MVSVYDQLTICEECIDFINQMRDSERLDRRNAGNKDKGGKSIPTPKKIHEFLDQYWRVRRCCFVSAGRGL